MSDSTTAPLSPQTAPVECLCDDIEELADEMAAAGDVFDGTDMDALAGLLGRLVNAAAALGSVREKVERAALRLMDGKEHRAGPVTLTRRAARKRERWDNHAVVSKVVAHAVDSREVDPETGEVADPVWAAAQALDDIYGITLPSKKPRTTALTKLLGWGKDDIEEYRTHDGFAPPTLQVDVPRREGVAGRG